MQLGILNAKNNCNMLFGLYPTSIHSPSLMSTLGPLFFNRKQKKIEMKGCFTSLPSLARGTRQMKGLLFISRQPPHSLKQRCQHCPAMPGNCCKCHCAGANLLPVPPQACEGASDVWSSTSRSCSCLPWLGNWVSLSIPISPSCWTQLSHTDC